MSCWQVWNKKKTTNCRLWFAIELKKQTNKQRLKLKTHWTNMFWIVSMHRYRGGAFDTPKHTIARYTTFLNIQTLTTDSDYALLLYLYVLWCLQAASAQTWNQFNLVIWNEVFAIIVISAMIIIFYMHIEHTL